LPSIEAIMPWLHLIFDAWEDHKKLREREAQAAAVMAADIGDDEAGDAEDEDGGKKKKKHKHRDKK
jgi:hypothetical protein